MDEKIVEVRQGGTGSSSSPGVIILQWLTYALWGWLLLSLVLLLFIIISNSMIIALENPLLPFAIAAPMVLLPIAVVCDLFYGPRESQHKAGAAMVVMVIHAVIFALFGIGMLISAILMIIQMAISTPVGSRVGEIAWIWTAFVSTALYLVVFLRTLNPAPKLRLARIFPYFMTVVVGVLIVVGFMGPVRNTSVTRDDRDIVANISDINQSVSNFVSDNKQLPTSLHETQLPEQSKRLVDRNLITYKPEGSVKSESSEQEFRYQLCATYRYPDTNEFESSNTDSEKYSDGVSAYDHPAGTVCYKLKAVTYN